jgi:hypothetical protein
VNILEGNQAGETGQSKGVSATRMLIFYWLPIGGYICIIFLLSSLSHIPFRFPFRHFDKLLHFSEYGILAILLARALGASNRVKSWWMILLLTSFFCVLLGAIDEMYQSTITNRDSDVFDAMADSAGGLIGGIAFFALRTIFKRREPTPEINGSN